MRILKTMGVLVLGGVLGVAATLAAQTAQSGTRREPQFENEHVRAWKSIIMPKQPLTMHRHEHHNTSPRYRRPGISFPDRAVGK